MLNVNDLFVVYSSFFGTKNKEQSYFFKAAPCFLKYSVKLMLKPFGKVFKHRGGALPRL